MSNSHEHLLNRVLGRDADALAQYVELNRGPLMGFIERRLGTSLRRKVEPEDILQEVTIDAVRSLGNVDFRD